MGEPTEAGGDERAVPAGGIRGIVKRVERIQLPALSPSVLERMDEELREEQEALAGRARELEAEIEGHIHDGQALAIAPLRKEVRQLGRSHAELEQERKLVRDARQERILRDRLAERLGSVQRVRALEGIVLGLILLVLSLLFYQFAHPGLPAETNRLIFLIDTLCCIVFLADFFFRHHCAESKRWYWRRYWIDFVTSIPIPDMQALRFGRVARVARVARAVRVVRVLRVIRLVLFFWRGMDKLNEAFNVRLLKRALLIGFALLVVGSLVIYWAERGERGVHTLGESAWWSLTTVITGGFADLYNPTTVTGRLLTLVLILAGMCVVGIFTATLTSVLVGDDSEQLALMQRHLEEKLDAISKRLDRLEAPPPPAPSEGPPGGSPGGE
jgi:voltage-gated potassium channel